MNNLNISSPTRKPVFELRGISKSYPGVTALDNVYLAGGEREIVGLVGENGAGKSTLAKIMAGFVAPDRGEIWLRGQVITPRSVKEAASYGIGMVYQERALLDNLTVAENIYLGNEESFIQCGLIRWSKLNRAAKALLTDLEIDISPTTSTLKLTFAQKQMVELARVVALSHRSQQAPVIIFDEPTTVGTEEDIERLFRTIAHLKERASIIFISHRLEEILRICNHLYVLKDGKSVADMRAADTTTEQLHSLMVGRQLSVEYYRGSEQTAPTYEVVLRLDKASVAGSFNNVSLSLRRGEILGIGGVLGSGREVLCRALAGATRLTSGQLFIEGKQVKLRSPVDASRLGIGYVPVERSKEGLIQYFPIASNISLANPRNVVRNGILSPKLERDLARQWMQRLGIKAPSEQASARTLSGGNQQKEVLAKWLAANVKVLILDHPTRGIDVGAKSEVYMLIRELAKQGLAILMISETLAEVIGLSNRVLVMKDGHSVVSFDAPANAKPQELQLIEHMM